MTESFDPAALPHFVDGEYRALSCKKVDDSGAVFLAERRDTGRAVLIKVTRSPEERLCLKNEYELLKRLTRTGDPAAARFPRAIEYLESGDSCALVREYIPGQSMEEYVESEPARPGIARDMALKCLISVLEQLIVLHRMRPPVIHRDIKPQNEILDDRGDFHLIDLGIAREYRAGDAADTRVMGTSLTAPPEQYGFRQTDARNDALPISQPASRNTENTECLGTWSVFLLGSLLSVEMDVERVGNAQHLEFLLSHRCPFGEKPGWNKGEA